VPRHPRRDHAPQTSLILIGRKGERPRSQSQHDRIGILLRRLMRHRQAIENDVKSSLEEANPRTRSGRHQMLTVNSNKTYQAARLNRLSKQQQQQRAKRSGIAIANTLSFMVDGYPGGRQGSIGLPRGCDSSRVVVIVLIDTFASSWNPRRHGGIVHSRKTKRRKILAPPLPQPCRPKKSAKPFPITGIVFYHCS
jgi:hypothetical protein